MRDDEGTDEGVTASSLGELKNPVTAGLRPGKGDYGVWTKGQIETVIVRTKQLSPGLTRSALKAIERSKNENLR